MNESSKDVTSNSYTLTVSFFPSLFVLFLLKAQHSLYTITENRNPFCISNKFNFRKHYL